MRVAEDVAASATVVSAHEIVEVAQARGLVAYDGLGIGLWQDSVSEGHMKAIVAHC